MPMKIKCAVIGVLSGAMLMNHAALAEPIVVTPVGKINHTDNSGSGAKELSGITHAGGNAYYAVSNVNGFLYSMTIDVNGETGAITGIAINPTALQLRDGAGTALSGGDREGVAYDPTSNRVFIANESGPVITGHAVGGAQPGWQVAQITTSSHPSLNVFGNTRTNYSWESLSRQPDGAAWWTANEEALTVDGPRATTTAGSIVRLQKFNGDFTPAGQWAYETDAIAANISLPEEYNSLKRSGISDLLALPDGRLIVMEREFGGRPDAFNLAGYRIRLYEVDFTEASDVSALGTLESATYQPVQKRALWEGSFPLDTYANFEGMTLGPQLDDGSYSLILIADNGGGSNAATHGFHALKISPVPEPATGMLLLGGAMLASRAARRSISR